MIEMHTEPGTCPIKSPILSTEVNKHNNKPLIENYNHLVRKHPSLTQMKRNASITSLNELYNRNVYNSHQQKMPSPDSLSAYSFPRPPQMPEISSPPPQMPEISSPPPQMPEISSPPLPNSLVSYTSPPSSMQYTSPPPSMRYILPNSSMRYTLPNSTLPSFVWVNSPNSSTPQIIPLTEDITSILQNLSVPHSQQNSLVPHNSSPSQPALMAPSQPALMAPSQPALMAPQSSLPQNSLVTQNVASSQSALVSPQQHLLPTSQYSSPSSQYSSLQQSLQPQQLSLPTPQSVQSTSATPYSVAHTLSRVHSIGSMNIFKLLSNDTMMFAIIVSLLVIVTLVIFSRIVSGKAKQPIIVLGQNNDTDKMYNLYN